jgi:heme-degrading monooxygenase HmoA
MFARVTTLQGPANSVEQLRTTVQQQVLPAVRAITGFRGLLSLADPITGKGVTVSLWESEEAMKQAEETANRLRVTTAAAAGADIVSVDRYEVLVDALSAGTV